MSNNVTIKPVNSFLKEMHKVSLREEKQIKESGDNINVIVSPAAKCLAKKLGVNLSRINGTGPNGRIIEKDILHYNKAMFSSRTEKELQFTEEELSPTRITIANELGIDFIKGVFVTQMTLANCENLFIIKENLNISITAIFIKMLGMVLREIPIFNAHFDGKKIKKFIDINIGIATDTKYGLVVPVAKKINSKDLITINQEVKFLTEAAKNKTLTRNQVEGSTFTISNVGTSRTDSFTPILHFPEVAILGVGRIDKGIKVNKDNSFKVERQVWLSLSYEHRIIDGVLAAKFLSRLCALLETLEGINFLLNKCTNFE